MQGYTADYHYHRHNSNNQRNVFPAHTRLLVNSRYYQTQHAVALSPSIAHTLSSRKPGSPAPPLARGSTRVSTRAARTVLGAVLRGARESPVCLRASLCPGRKFQAGTTRERSPRDQGEAAGCRATVLTTAPPRHPHQKIVFAPLLLYFLSLSPSLPHRPKTRLSTHEAASLLNIYFSFFFPLEGEPELLDLMCVLPAATSAVQSRGCFILPKQS